MIKATLVLLALAGAAHAQETWNFTGSASGNLVTESPSGTDTLTPASMDFTASFVVTDGVMTSYSVNGQSGTGSGGYFGPGGEISPLINAQGVVYGGEVQYTMNGPTSQESYSIDDGSVSFTSTFWQSDGTVIYESLSGSGGWVDPPTATPELSASATLDGALLLIGGVLVLRSRPRPIGKCLHTQLDARNQCVECGVFYWGSR
jgi:hypothetical protein